MSVSKTDLVKALREQEAELLQKEAELLQKLEATQLALKALNGRSSRRASATRKRTEPSLIRRVKKPREVEAEVRRVLTEAGRPMVVREIMELGDFACTNGGVYSAADRMRDVESAGKLRYKDRTSTAFKLRSLRIRPGEGVVDD